MIQFKKLIVHNFGSYSHTEIDLQNKGFCLVSGQNNYKKDNALSNGSGKSFLWNAVCFALTGETINGIKTNLKNINIAEPDCFVQLDFVYDKDLFSLVRTVTPKSELRIVKNDVDLSGKGIRESEKKLQELLPELTKDLIASTIIIGQGMPNKFSSFSPSGRKELLEKLTKSDFMIEDLKTRIAARHQELSQKVREHEDSLIANNTQLSIYSSNLTKLSTELEQLVQPDFDTLIVEQMALIGQLQGQLTALEADIVASESEVELLNTKLVEVSEDKARVSAEELTAYTNSKTKLTTEKTKLDMLCAELSREIKKLKTITDTCPTCGQHLPNVIKPSTAEQEGQLAEYQTAASKLADDISRCEAQHREYLAQIDTAFKDEISQLNNALLTAKQKLSGLRSNYNNIWSSLETAKAKHSKLADDKQNWDKRVKAQEQEIARYESEIARLTNLIRITTVSKNDFADRLAIIKKMDTLIRRDFRGYLLTNIITYLDSRAKEYCNIVFGTKELSLALNGNALDITYCGKMFDGLSGGEKQRVDLILQLAIRDMLTSYLDLSANILVLDEITDFLDKKSCQAVMQLLEQELQTVESVFIISHHAEELELPIDSEIRIVKNAEGISELT